MFNYRAFVVAVALTLAVSAHAKTIIVNNNSALKSVSPVAPRRKPPSMARWACRRRDIIEICPGIYPETLSITTSKLTIEGLNVGGFSLVELEPTKPAAAIPILAHRSMGLQKTHGQRDHRSGECNEVTLENIAVNVFCWAIPVV